jgi:hypothetical protein
MLLPKSTATDTVPAEEAVRAPTFSPTLVGRKTSASEHVPPPAMIGHSPLAANSPLMVTITAVAVPLGLARVTITGALVPLTTVSAEVRCPERGERSGRT